MQGQKWDYIPDNLGMFRRPTIGGINTTVIYVTTLQENLLPFIETMPLHIKHDFIFQQDNATIHTARITKAWFAEQAFKVMEWPPNSPDMNPIEHMWRVLKAALHKRFPDTSTLRGGPEKVREVLKERLRLFGMTSERKY